MTDISKAPLTGKTLVQLDALQDAMNTKIEQIARECFMIRGAYRLDASQKPANGGNQLECFERWELWVNDPANIMVEAIFTWWWGDEEEVTSLKFPLAYLDMNEEQWTNQEAIAKAAKQSEKAKQDEAKAAQKAKEDAIAAELEREQELAQLAELKAKYPEAV